MSDSDQVTTDAAVDDYIFRRSIHMQVMVQGLLKAAGDISGKRCLAIGSPNAMMSRQLRLAGGNWKELAFSDEMRERVAAITGDNSVKVYKGDGKLPFRDKSFDLIFILAGLSDQKSDYDFVEMCHKVIDSDGHLIVCVPREKKLSLIGPIRSLFGVSETVYNERKLFDILKNGFDVLHMRSSSRFFIELVDAITRGMSKKSAASGGDRTKAYKIAYPFYAVAYQLDALIFFTRGHRLIASAKRHSWRSRTAPILSDGRSISEAVLKPLTG
jgi:hypothetical protein